MNAQRARQPDCTVYIHLELSLVCFVFRVVSSSESKRLIFCESCMLENGAACYKLSSVISKTVRLMGSSTRCENKEGFVVIPANVSASLRFIFAALGALQSPHLTETE